MHSVRLIPVAVVIAAVLTGCGSSSNSSSSAATSQSASAPAQRYSSSASTGSPAGVTPAALITTKPGKLGTILAYGPKKLTVYLFEQDRADASRCTAACATAWPPVLGRPDAGPGAAAADLGTIKRSDGTTQVTYKGHPLYRFIKDKDDGDSYGEGVKAFGASWYVLRPSGNKVDRS